MHFSQIQVFVRQEQIYNDLNVFLRAEVIMTFPVTAAGYTLGFTKCSEILGRASGITTFSDPPLEYPLYSYTDRNESYIPTGWLSTLLSLKEK